MKSEQVLIRAENVGLTYSMGAFWNKSYYTPIEGISFDVISGQNLGIIGRNGAGKSTLLRLLAGIILPDEGRIIKGPEVSVSMLVANAGFDPFISGRDNIYLAGMIFGLSRKDIDQKMPKIVEFAGIGDWIDKPLRTYSSGMAARVGFSLSLEMTPDVLLIDEAMGAGDENFRKKARTKLLKKIQSDQTTVIVSHDLDVLSDLCTRVIWIHEKHIVMDDDPQKVTKEYLKTTGEKKNKRTRSLLKKG
jgi:homopolymeric O-antigen transport system ATP-binding protein